MLRNNYQSRNLIGHYPLWVISPRNSTSFTRPFLAGRRARAGHETTACPPCCAPDSGLVCGTRTRLAYCTHVCVKMVVFQLTARRLSRSLTDFVKLLEPGLPWTNTVRTHAWRDNAMHDRDVVRYHKQLMRLSMLCPTIPCMGNSGARWGFD